MLFTLCHQRARACALAESLEGRSLFSVSLDHGWAVVTPSDDTRTIYVSSSTGSDDNNGRSATHPVRTLKHAKSMLRDGKPDHLLLKRGDRFAGGLGDWTISGRSEDEPIL